jgi:hypothetical protein
MLHAFTSLPSAYRWGLLALFFVGTAAFAVKLALQGKPLRTEAAPNGILSYEFAWDRSQAERIIGSWGSLKDTAEHQLWWDFGFLVFYPLLLSLACAMLAESPFNSMAAVGIFISWAVLAAGPLDAVENIALLRMLDVGASGFMARLAGWCAGVKFVLAYASLGYIVLQGVCVLISKMRAA